MSSNSYLYLLLVVSVTSLFLTISCQDDSSSPPPAPASAPPPTAAAAAPAYPRLPLDSLAYLWTTATYLDATFYNLPASINQSTPGEIQRTLAMIDTETDVTIKPDCPAFGHLWFQVNGKNVRDADIYFAEGCTYHVWYENGKPAYANALTPAGVQFYNNIIQSVQNNVGG